MSASFISKRVACDGKLDFRARAYIRWRGCGGGGLLRGEAALVKLLSVA